MRIRNAIIITNDDSPIEMDLNETGDLSGCAVIAQSALDPVLLTRIKDAVGIAPCGPDKHAAAWQPIETAPAGPHLRAIWVTYVSGEGGYWDVAAGYVDGHSGEFVTMGGDYTGWSTTDWQLWAPLTLPEPPR